MFVFVFLALISASVADIDRNKETTSSVPVYTSDWLKKILADREQNPVVGDAAPADIDSYLISIGLNTTAKISKMIGLKEILKSGPGPFTILLPNEAACKELLIHHDDVVSDIGALTQVIEAGIVEGISVESASITNDKVLRSINGAKLRFNVHQNNGKQVKTVNGFRIVDVDRKIENIVIHVIDHVIYPIPDGNIVQILSKIPSKFDTFLDIISHAALEDTISRTDPLTVFAPTDEAFYGLPGWASRKIRGNFPAIQKLVKYHVIKQSQFSAGLNDREELETMEGSVIHVHKSDDDIWLHDVYQQPVGILARDVPADNGVIYVIDKVLLPTDLESVFV